MSAGPTGERIGPEALTFDDVLLVPGLASVHPRDIDISTKFSRNIPLNVPILSAAMDTVTESELAIALIKDEDAASIASGTVKDTVLNKDVPSALQTPQSIFKDNVKDVIDDGFWKAADICTGAYAQACTAAGIK